MQVGAFPKARRRSNREVKVFQNNQRQSKGCDAAFPVPASSLTLKSVTFHVRRANKYTKIIWRWKFREVWKRKDLVSEGFVKRIAA